MSIPDPANPAHQGGAEIKMPDSVQARAIEVALCTLARCGWKFSGYFNTDKEIAILARSEQGQVEVAAKIFDPYRNPSFEFYVDEKGVYHSPSDLIK